MATDREVRRRRVIALGGAALASLAGCPGDGDSGSATETTTGTATRTATTETRTTPTATDSPARFSDDFTGERLARYRPVSGTLDPWSTTEKIDDGSALVDTTGSGGESLLAPLSDALAWPGTGTISVDVQFGTAPAFRNCKVGIGDVPDGSSTYVQFAPRQLVVSAPNGDLRQEFPEIGPGGVHRLAMTLDDGTITATVDDQHRVELAVDEPLPTGTVAFGIEANPTGDGGKTWFDNLVITAES